jgi:hypothetical protein
MNGKEQLPDFTPVNMGIFQKEPVVNLGESNWLPCEFRFRGLRTEISKLQEYLTQNKMHITYNTAVSEEVSEIRVIAESATVTLIEKFPALKATGLVENWDKYRGHGIYVAYSESGYSVITDFAYAGEFEGHHDGGDGRWEWEYDMMEPVDVRFSRLQANAVEEVHYRHPFRSKWERNYYVREVNGVICAPVTSEEFQIENGVLRGYFGPGGPVHIPDSLEKIEPWAFFGCSSLKEIRIPGSVTVIPEAMLSECTALETVVIEEGVTEIGDFAFAKCKKLKHVSLPGSIRKKIRKKLFEKNPNLVIHGVPGSPAETYAKEKGFRFAANNADTGR